ncbi:PepSY domain-containing protein [Marinobacter sp. SS13-12]|uniref:PepSY domain-containing protein n=1 Tax=Marinobacter sp. SS13-12 TaxID=3050451 RepID=UPI00255291D0|nr:PepSY domain-containing protein [Marinobacter sp. SS13-12]MDK8465449.1 PepSY domain-containing protein [Marinobacter sp. SS13-12]
MKTKPVILSLTLLLLSAPLLADDDCDDPVANWQPRENLRQKLEAEGWTVYRIKVDDGCYEVKGLAPQGFRAEASFAPASLNLMELEREEDDDDDDDEDNDGRYGTQMPDAARGKGQGPVPDNGIVKGRPSVTVE